MKKPTKKRTKKKSEKMKKVAKDSLDKMGTVVALEYFLPHFVEPSFLAVAGVLCASLLVFVLHVYRELTT